MNGKAINILLVEDSVADVRMIRELMKECKVLNNMHSVADGVEALQFLRREGSFKDAIQPDLILLDLNLPRKDGREVLKEIKQDPALKRIPVVVLTTSSDGDDIFKSYDLHANSYIVKPVDIVQFIKVIKSIESFWLTIVELPRGSK